MPGVRVTIRMVALATMLATYNFWVFTLITGPFDVQFFFPSKIVPEFGTVSDRILSTSRSEAEFRPEMGREAILSRSDNSINHHAEIGEFARRHSVWGIAIDHDQETVEWYFMFYYRMFIVYVYCPNEKNFPDVRGRYEERFGEVTSLSDKWFIYYY
jgi:hypothetical protein